MLIVLYKADLNKGIGFKMRQKPHYIARILTGPWLRLICLSLFFVVQTLTLSHATEHGDEHHEHDGVSCTISLIAPEVDAVEPPAPILSVPEAYKAPTDFTAFISQRYIYNECRGPPGRAPPAFSI